MPCWQVREVEIDFSKANVDVMRKALEGLGLRVQTHGKTMIGYEERYGDPAVRWEIGGKLTVWEKGESWAGKVGVTESDVRQAYSAKAIEATAQKFSHWRMVKKSENVFEFERSY